MNKNDVIEEIERRILDMCCDPYLARPKPSVLDVLHLLKIMRVEEEAKESAPSSDDDLPF